MIQSFTFGHFRDGTKSLRFIMLWKRFAWATIVISGIFLPGLWAPTVQAHGGGTPRLTNEEAGPYRIFVWTNPEPLTVGEIHLSIAVSLSQVDSNQARIDVPVTDAEILVTIEALEGTEYSIIIPAQHQSLLNAIYYEADTEIPFAGPWRVSLTVTDKEGKGEIDFDVQIVPVRPLNWPLLLGASTLLLLIFALMILWSRMQTGTANDSEIS